MATFPALTPSAAPIAPGAWPSTAHSSLNGAESRIRHGSAEIGRRLALTFTNVTEADFLAILNHYRTQRSGFDSFGFTTTTLAADLTPTGFAWVYASRPQVVDDHADCFTVSCEFRCEPRGLVVAPGKVWRTGATTLTPGSRSGGVVYGAAAAWVTSSTTFNPGARNSGIGSNGVAWVTSSTTLYLSSDPNFSSVVLLCGFNGTNGSTTIVDEGPLGLTLTASGSAQISTSQSVFGGSSLSMAGSGAVALPSNSSLTLTGDFTLDARCRFNQTRKDMILGSASVATNHQISRESGTQLGVRASATVTASLTTSTNTWYALRWARSGSTVYFFADGTLLGTATLSGTLDFSGGRIGNLFGNDILDGFIDELRLTTMCRSTTSYTVDTAPFPRF